MKTKIKTKEKTYKEIKKEINTALGKTKISGTKDWEFFIETPVEQETVQAIVDVCKYNLLLDWHIIFGTPTEKTPHPKARIYWDRGFTKNDN